MLQGRVRSQRKIQGEPQGKSKFGGERKGLQVVGLPVQRHGGSYRHGAG